MEIKIPHIKLKLMFMKVQFDGLENCRWSLTKEGVTSCHMNIFSLIKRMLFYKEW